MPTTEVYELANMVLNTLTLIAMAWIGAHYRDGGDR